MFKDIKGHYFEQTIREAASKGLAGGYPDGTFKPDKPVTRAEVTAFNLRNYKKTKENFLDIVEQVTKAVVTVEGEKGLGSGTIISKKGYVLTNAHVVQITDAEGNVTGHEKTVGFRIAGSPYYAEGPVLAVSDRVDLAVCRIELSGQNWHILKISDDVKRGQPILAIGSPLGFHGTVTQGIVSYVERGLNYTGTPIYDMIQIDAAINPGNSGGALVDLEGRLIGVPSVKLSGVGIEGLAFAIGAGTIQKFIGQAIQERRIEQLAGRQLLSELKLA